MSLKHFLPLVLFLTKPAHSFEFDEIKQAVFQIPNTGSADIPSYDTPTRTCVNSNAPPTSGAMFAAATAVSIPTGITINVDPATPSLDFKRTSKQGLAYELIWSEEFVMDGREFGFSALVPTIHFQY
ncbi:hypothetical protein CPB84DRAFT_1787423 [Gymnopilus junonius]|uniref:Uncharacterized protein n=1 Tax=Gymnopilus junonius TaxID=109634 RepID=A0A9P5NEZ4_GYMJU|nr:hypothetical protein CPB84DRAFT_1787423 [Gymnopilus junonius]